MCWRKLSNASAKSVDAVELKLVDGQTIVWGNAGEKELKAKVLEALLKAPADPKNPVRIYDVSVPQAPGDALNPLYFPVFPRHAAPVIECPNHRK